MIYQHQRNAVCSTRKKRNDHNYCKNSTKPKDRATKNHSTSQLILDCYTARKLRFYENVICTLLLCFIFTLSFVSSLQTFIFPFFFCFTATKIVKKRSDGVLNEDYPSSRFRVYCSMRRISQKKERKDDRLESKYLSFQLKYEG